MNGIELIRTIREAFRDVKLEDGISLNMTEYYDSYEAEEQFKQLAIDDECNDWQKIEDKILEKFTVTFCFTDWKGFRFYLPAYMIWTISHRGSGSVIGDHTIYALDPGNIYKLYGRTINEILNNQQMQTVIQFLQFCGDDPDYHDAKSAATNLKRMRADFSE
jgi:hypothetical protein